jgi:hypothetical protein
MSPERSSPSAPLDAVQAPVNGAGLYLGYQSMRVQVPVTGALVEFRYVDEPPHGDALLEMRLQERIFPGLVWGSMTYWSPDGRYLVMDWAGAVRGELRRTCVLVNLQLWRYALLDSFRPVSINAEGINGNGGGGATETIRPDQVAGWQPG